MTDSSMIRPEDAARQLMVSKQTLAKWRHLHFGPSYVKLGRSVFYRQSDIETFIQSNVHAAEVQS